MNLGCCALCVLFMFPQASPFLARPLELAVRRFTRMPTPPARRQTPSFSLGAHADEAALLAPRLPSPLACFDAHCHLQLAGAVAAAHALQSLAEGERVALMSVSSSCPRVPPLGCNNFFPCACGPPSLRP
jgi:hypothetical protein